MSLWVDKHKPTTLGKLTIHKHLTNKLLSLANNNELPHLLFYGSSGVGKKTRILLLLKEIYGNGVEKLKVEHQRFKVNNNKVIELLTLGSNYHIECNPSEVGNNDRFVVQEVIKDIASHSTLHSNQNNSSSFGSSASANSDAEPIVKNKNFKVVLITEADRLSKQAQAGLRRTMEKYSSQCRIILLCNSPTKIIEPLRSRCLGIRIPAPTASEISDILGTVAKKESLHCPQELLIKISLSCDRNIRRALLILESMKVQANSNTLSNDQLVLLPDWELYIIRIAREILTEQTPSKLLQIREMLYNLLTNCIPSDVIITTLSRELMKALDDSLKHELAHWACFYEHRIVTGSKDIFHLEAFVAKFMAIYKKWIVSMFF